VVLTLTGTDGNDNWSLQRDARQPSLLDIQENGGTVQSFQLSTIQRIEVSGQGGDDTLVIDVSNGPIGVAKNIHFDGRTGTNHLLLKGAPKDAVVNKFDSAQKGEGTFAARNPFGTFDIQDLSWDNIND